MNQQEEFKLAQEFFDNCMLTLKNKAHDYAQDGDCFSNFKKIALMLDMPVEKTFLIFMVVKIARIVELIKKKETKVGESIEDSLGDISNYGCLLNVYLKGKK